jgi:uncharacterized protein YukE
MEVNMFTTKRFKELQDENDRLKQEIKDLQSNNELLTKSVTQLQIENYKFSESALEDKTKQVDLLILELKNLKQQYIDKNHEITIIKNNFQKDIDKLKVETGNENQREVDELKQEI